MTDLQKTIIDVLEREAPLPMTNAEITNLAGVEKIWPATLTALVKKGLIQKVEDSRPAQYFVPSEAVGGDTQAIIAYLERAQHAGAAKIAEQLGDWVLERLPQLVEEGVLIFNADFQIYALPTV